MAGVLHKFRVADSTTRSKMLEQESAEGLKAISVGLRLKGGGKKETIVQRIQEALEQEARACDPSTATGRIVVAMGKVGDLAKASTWLTANYKGDDLKALCVELRLSKTGKKSDLAERICTEALELWKVQASRAAGGSTAGVAAPVEVEAGHESPAAEEAAAQPQAVPETPAVEEAAAQVEAASEEPAPKPTPRRSRSRRGRPAEVEQFFRENEEEAEEVSDWQEPQMQPTPSVPPVSAMQDQLRTPAAGQLQPQDAYPEAPHPESLPEDPLPQRPAVPQEPVWQPRYRDAAAAGEGQLEASPEEVEATPVAEDSWPPHVRMWDVGSGTELPSQAREQERYPMADVQDAASSASSSSIPGAYDSTRDEDVVKTEPIRDKEEEQMEKRHRRFVERRMKLVGYLAEEVANAYGGYKNNYVADMNQMLTGASDRAREAYLSDKLEEPTPAMLTQRVPEILGPTCQAPEFGAWHPEPVQHEMQMIGELGPARLAWCKWWDQNTGCGELVDLDDQRSVAVVSAALTTGANVSPKLKYLTHGEFVEYRRVDQGAGQAPRGILVRGLRGWPLMCEVDGSRALPSGG